MIKNKSILFAPHFTEEVARVQITGEFDPATDLWVGSQNGPKAPGLTGGDATTTVSVGTTKYDTNYIEPDTGYDDIPDDYPDRSDYDFC